MKIAFFTETYLPNIDGVVRSITTARGVLEQKGFDVYVFTSGSIFDKRRNKDKKVFYHLGSPFLPYPQYKVAIFPFLTSGKVFKLGIDLIHTHGMATMGLAALQAKFTLSKPMVGTFHTMVSEIPFYMTPVKRLYPWVTSVMWKYSKWYFNQCDITTCPAQSIVDEMSRHGVKNLSVVPNGVDIKDFTPKNRDEGLMKKLGLGDKKVLLYAGRIAKEKNLLVLPEVVKNLPEDYHLLVIGDGPFRKNLDKGIRHSGVQKRVTLAGRVDEKTLKACYASSHAFVFPSTFETQGIVALEAMASGLPVIGANAHGIRDVVLEGKTGYLVNPNDPKDYAKKIVELEANLEKFSRTAVSHVRDNYSLESTVGKFIKIYEEYG